MGVFLPSFITVRDGVIDPFMDQLIGDVVMIQPTLILEVMMKCWPSFQAVILQGLRTKESLHNSSVLFETRLALSVLSTRCSFYKVASHND